ncbi:phosphotransferase family protein [Zavarzinia aquatilis]|nr:aminoglycoside phosphotransferase family protein [Zavarzinia aquatilis]
MTTDDRPPQPPAPSPPDPGGRIGTGGKSDIFDLGDGRVLKLYHERFAAETGRGEYDLTRAAAAAGLPVWQVHGVEERAGRIGLVGDFVPGVDVSTVMTRQPWRTFGLIRRLADIQQAFHRAPVDMQHPARQMSLDHALGLLRRLDPPFAALVADILRQERALAFCHGDFHGANARLGAGRITILDLERAGRGEPDLDVARSLSWLLLGKGEGRQAGAAERAFRFWMVEIYLARYCAAAGRAPLPALAWLVAEICRRRRGIADDRTAEAHLRRLRSWLFRLNGR